MSPRERASWKARRWGLTASAIGAGLAVALLVSAVGLALWSWLAAEPSPALGAWQQVNYSPWGTGSLGAQTPGTIAVALCGISAVLLVSVLAAWLLRRRRSLAWIPAGVLSVLALGWMYVKGNGLADFVSRAQTQPRTPQLPMMITAWRLEQIALVALIIGCPMIVRMSRRWWWSRAVVGVVAGLVLSVMATGVAWYAGYDRQFVEASSTTTAVPDLAVPRALGDKHFAVQIASASDHNAWYVEPIVGGFVTVGDGRLTAFDGKGNERWYYRRSGPNTSQVTSVQVFDGGRTLVAGIGPAPSVLIGLDAASGTQLWWSSDPALMRTQGPTARRASSPRPYLLDYNVNTRTWSRFDTRTGNLMWSGTAPEPQCADRFDTTAAPAQSLLWCRDGLTFVSVDPDTGETDWQTTLPIAAPVTKATIARAGAGAVVVSATSDTGRERSVHIDLASHAAHPLVSATTPIDTIDPARDFLAEVGERLSLRGSDGRERCALSNGPPSAGTDGRALVLTDQVVLAEPPGLRTFNPTTCAPTNSNRLPSIPQALVAAPGVLLVARADASGTWIDGYA